jgi:hypothetical protein
MVIFINCVNLINPGNMQIKHFIKHSVRYKTICLVRGFLESNPPPNMTKSDSLFSRKFYIFIILYFYKLCILENMQNKQFIKHSVRFKTIYLVRGYDKNMTKSDGLFTRKLRQTVINF